MDQGQDQEDVEDEDDVEDEEDEDNVEDEEDEEEQEQGPCRVGNWASQVKTCCVLGSAAGDLNVQSQVNQRLIVSEEPPLCEVAVQAETLSIR